jgi:hypothetical protein
VSRIWKPVQRRGAERYIQLTILSFAASVSITRLILELTNFPQLGNETLHIAHVLYGGIFLYSASLLPLLYANRWAYTWSAILSGLGVGLFIDEVGKFITRNNDYFFPAAAPIIYAFFLLIVLLYQRINKDPKLDVRGYLYSVIEILQEVLDHSLEPSECEEMNEKLTFIIEKTNNPHFKSLAIEIQDFVDSDALKTITEKENFFDKIIARWTRFEEKFLTKNRMKVVLMISLILLGVPSSLRLLDFSLSLRDAASIEFFLNNITQDFPENSSNNIMWVFIFIIMDGLVGLLLSIGGIQILVGQLNWGTELASFGLVIKLVAVNLVLFYIRQFETIISAGYQFLVLQGIYFFQRKHLKNMRVKSQWVTDERT